MPFLNPPPGPRLGPPSKAAVGNKIIVFVLRRFCSPMKLVSETPVYLGFQPDIQSVTTLVTTLLSLTPALKSATVCLRGVRTGHNSTRVNAQLRICIVALPPSNTPTFRIDLYIWWYPCTGPNLRLENFQWWWSISRAARNEVSAPTLKGVGLLLSNWYKVYDYSSRS